MALTRCYCCTGPVQKSSSLDWGWSARGDNKRNILSREWLSAFKWDVWSVLEGNTDIWNGRELLSTLSRSSQVSTVPGKHGDLTSRLVQDNLQITAYWQELQVHFQDGESSKKVTTWDMSNVNKRQGNSALLCNQVYCEVLYRRKPKQIFQWGKTFDKQQWWRRLQSKLNESLLVT